VKNALIKVSVASWFETAKDMNNVINAAALAVQPALMPSPVTRRE
jgi:hypothetical protein